MKPWEMDFDTDTSEVEKKPWEMDFADNEPEVDKQPERQPEKKEGYISGINKAMDDRALEGAMKNLIPEKYPMQHAVQNLNTLVAIPLSGLGKAAEPITKPLGKVLKPVAKGILEGAAFAGGQRKANFDNTSKTIAPIIQKATEIKRSNPVLDVAGDIVGDVGELAGNVTGIGATAKLTPIVAKEMSKLPSKVGSGLVDAGKNFKLGDMKIKDAIAKKGYGKDLIDKKNNIANTIYEYGLTTGGNKGGAAKAAELSQEIFDRVDGMVTDLSALPNAPKVNPVKELMSGIDPMKAPAGKRKQAQAIIDGIVEDLNIEGLNQDLTIDKLIQAKRSLDPDGNLFKNGPGATTDDILDRAIRKKMYLNLVEKIGDVSPEIKALNREAKKLIDAESALSAASSRIANKDAISLTDWVLGAGTLANPSALPLLAVKKGLAGGRGSDLVINTGRALKGDKVKTVDDIIESVRAKTPLEKSTDVPLPKDWNIPAYQRKGIEPEIITPITDKKRLLSPPMVGGNTNIQKPIPSVGDRIRAVGEPTYRDLYPDQKKLPSPQDVKRQYPHLSKENERPIISKLDDRKALPAPMINDPAQSFERQVPTLGQRLERVGTSNKVFENPGTQALTIVPDKELVDFLQRKGIIEEMQKLKEGVPVNLSEDQLGALQEFADYMTRMKGNETLRKTSYQPKKQFKKKY